MTALASEAQPHTTASDTARENARRLEIFTARLLGGLPSDVAARISAARRAQLSAEALEFFSLRAEPIKVRVVIAPQSEGGGFAETVMEDCPFIIDSMLEYFHHLDIGTGLLVHPVLLAARDGAGRLVSLEGMRSIEHPESFVHLELRLDRGTHDAERIAAGLRNVLEQVRAATGDFEAMTARALEICEETAAQRELVEVRDLLRWLVGGGFVFLGYRRYPGGRRGRPSHARGRSGLGTRPAARLQPLALRAAGRSQGPRTRPSENAVRGSGANHGQDPYDVAGSSPRPDG